jgi:hypothetical protein
LYPGYVVANRIVQKEIPFGSPRSAAEYTALGYFSGALGNEADISLIDACSYNGSLAGVIRYLRNNLGKATDCRCVDTLKESAKNVRTTERAFSMPNGTLHTVRSRIETAELKTSDQPTYLLGNRTCTGTLPLIERLATEKPAKLPDHVGIRSCCHVIIQDREIKELTEGLSKRLQQFLLQYKKWISEGRLSFDQDEPTSPNHISHLTLQRIIDCLRARKLAQSGNFKARVLEMPTETEAETGSDTFIFADKV